MLTLEREIVMDLLAEPNHSYRGPVTKTSTSGGVEKAIREGGSRKPTSASESRTDGPSSVVAPYRHLLCERASKFNEPMLVIGNPTTKQRQDGHLSRILN